MNTEGGPGILYILQHLSYTFMTVRYYTIISLFLDSVHPLRSNKGNFSRWETNPNRRMQSIDMYSAVTDSNSFSQIKGSVFCLLTLAEFDHNLMTLVRAGSLLTYCHMRGLDVIQWVLGGNKYDCSSVTYISKNICLCYYFSVTFLQLGPIIMKIFDMCDAQFYILHSATVQGEQAMTLFVHLTISNVQ